MCVTKKTLIIFKDYKNNLHNLLWKAWIGTWDDEIESTLCSIIITIIIVMKITFTIGLSNEHTGRIGMMRLNPLFVPSSSSSSSSSRWHSPLNFLINTQVVFVNQRNYGIASNISFNLPTVSSLSSFHTL